MAMSTDKISSKRDLSIDIARGVGMICVVIGHMIEFKSMSFYVYLFHMPLFFILSGIVFKRDDILVFTYHKTLSLMSSYLVFIFVVLIADNFLSIFSGVGSFLDISNPIQFLPRIIFGGPSLVAAFTVFWFVGCLWIASLMYNGILHVGETPFDWRILLLVGGSYFVAMVERPGLMLPQGLGAVPLAIVFLWVGSVFAVVRGKRSLLLAGSLACVALLFPFVDKLDMKIAQNGNLANLPFAVAASVFVVISSFYLQRVRYVSDILIYIGKSSFTIMFLHNLIIIHGRVFVADRYLLLLIAVVVPALIHSLLEQNAFTERFVLGRFWGWRRPVPAVV